MWQELEGCQCLSDTLQFVREEGGDDTGGAGGERTHQLTVQGGIMGWAEVAGEWQWCFLTQMYLIGGKTHR